MANANAQVFGNDVINWIRGTVFPTVPATFYVALLTAVPTKNDGTGLTEVSGSSYARQGVASGTAQWSAAAQSSDTLHQQTTNVNAITFPAVTSSSYTVVGWAIYDALTVGNLLWYGAVTSQAVSVGNQYQIAAGALAIEQ